LHKLENFIFVPVLGAARVAQIDVLLGILAVVVYIVGGLSEMGRAWHAGVAIGHIKNA
jgi:hypothetical protein